MATEQNRHAIMALENLRRENLGQLDTTANRGRIPLT